MVHILPDVSNWFDRLTIYLNNVEFHQVISENLITDISLNLQKDKDTKGPSVKSLKKLTCS